jgi:hypothetical protein
MVVDISGGTSVSVVGKAHEGCGGVRTCHSPGIHFAEYHTGGLNEAKGGVYGEELAGRARAECIGIIHAKTIRYPIVVVSRELREFVGAVGGGWEGFLQLIIWASVIPANPETTVLDVDVFGGVMGGFANNVGAGGRRGFGLGVEAACQHFRGPSREHGDGPRAPFRDGNADMFPIGLEI